MAHPALYDSMELLAELAEEKKLDGVEVYHYSADDNQKKEMLDIAEKYDLIVTGGSDFHGCIMLCRLIWEAIRHQKKILTE